MIELLVRLRDFLGENLWIIRELIVAAIGAMIFFVVNKIVTKGEEKKEKLKRHFDQLKSNVIDPMIKALIHLHSPYMEASYDLSGNFDFESGVYFSAFESHFRTESSRWRQLMGKVREQNESYFAFVGEVEAAIKQGTGLPLSNGYPAPFVYANTVVDVRHTLLEIARGLHPFYDFQNAWAKQVGTNWQLQYGTKPDGNKTFVVETTERGVEKCRSVLTGLQHSPKFTKIAAEIVASRIVLDGEIQNLRAELQKICEDYGEYRYKLLRKLPRCPICSGF